jgi:hypothetical protein
VFMKALRRGSGGIAAVLAYVLVLQTLAIGLALGSMATAQAGTLGVICTSNGPVAIALEVDPNTSPTSDPHWPCSAFCQLAASASGLLGSGVGHVSAPSSNVNSLALAPVEAPRRTLARFVAEARAPPVSI